MDQQNPFWWIQRLGLGTKITWINKIEIDEFWKEKKWENIPLLGKWDLVWVSGNDVMWFLIPFLRKWDSYETNNWNKHLKLKYNIWKGKKKILKRIEQNRSVVTAWADGEIESEWAWAWGDRAWTGGEIESEWEWERRVS